MQVRKSVQKWLMTAVIAVALIAVIAMVLRPSPVQVDLVDLQRGSLSIVVEEQGRTRASQRFLVSSPVTGQLLRTELQVGQAVQQGDVLVRIAPPPEDPRTQATARAELSAAEARQRETEAVLQEARSTLEHAESELARRTDLLARGLISIETQDQYERSVEAARARVASSRAAVAAAQAQVESARSRLLGSGSGSLDDDVIEVRAPAKGQVLQIMEENERVVPAGAVLFEIGAGDSLELVIDVLTQDAVSIQAGDEIRVTGWGGNGVLIGTVSYTEPRAFTKVSTLGVEEQRVNVIGYLDETPIALGAEYRIDASIVTWQDDDVLLIPTSALFRLNDAWHTFVVTDGIARLTRVDIGQRGKNQAELLDGAKEGDRVIRFPSDLVKDGVRVSES